MSARFRRAAILSLLALAAVLALSMGAVTACRALNAAEPMVLRIGYSAPEGHPVHQAVQAFSSSVASETRQRIKFDVQALDSQAAGDLVNACIDGRFDLVLVQQPQIAMYVRKFAVTQLPYVFQSADQAFKTLNGPFREWVEPDMKAFGLTYLAAWDWGYSQIANRMHTVRTPDDFRGMRIATNHSVQAQRTLIAFGARPVPIPRSMTADVFATDLADGYDQTILEYQYGRLLGPGTYIAQTNHSLNTLSLVIGSNTLSRMTAEETDIILKASRAAGDQLRRLGDDATRKALADLRRQGVEIVPVDQSLFHAALIDQMGIAEDYIGHDHIQAFKSMLNSIKGGGSYQAKN